MMRLSSYALDSIKRWLTLFVIGLTCTMPSLAQPSTSFDLSNYRWKNRILLVFSPGSDHEAYRELKQNLKEWKQDFEDRDMLLIEVLNNTGRAGPDSLAATAVTALRQRFNIPETTFGVFLIGKDGGVKMQAEQADILLKIFALIDTMPMRQREMKTRGQK